MEFTWLVHATYFRRAYLYVLSLSGRFILAWSRVPRLIVFSKPICISSQQLPQLPHKQVGALSGVNGADELCNMHGARQVETLEEVEELVVLGGRNRTVGNNNVNEHSSRSHLVLQVHITSMDVASGYVQHGKLNLIDLAGSERIKVRLRCLICAAKLVATATETPAVADPRLHPSPCFDCNTDTFWHVKTVYGGRRAAAEGSPEHQPLTQRSR